MPTNSRNPTPYVCNDEFLKLVGSQLMESCTLIPLFLDTNFNAAADIRDRCAVSSSISDLENHYF